MSSVNKYTLVTRVLMGNKTIGWEVITDTGTIKKLSLDQVLEDSRQKKITNAIYCAYNDGLRGKNVRVQSLGHRQYKSVVEAVKLLLKDVKVKSYKPGSLAYKVSEKAVILLGDNEYTLESDNVTKNNNKVSPKQIMEFVEGLT